MLVDGEARSSFGLFGYYGLNILMGQMFCECFRTVLSFYVWGIGSGVFLRCNCGGMMKAVVADSEFAFQI